MSVLIQRAQPEDFDGIKKVVFEGHMQHVEALPKIFKPVNEVMPKAYFDDLLNEQNQAIFVAKESEEIIGFAVIEIFNAPPFNSLVQRSIAYINDFGVKETAQKKGVGNQLFEACKAWSSKSGAETLELTVWEFNHQAIKFYEKMHMKSISRKMAIDL